MYYHIAYTCQVHSVLHKCIGSRDLFGIGPMSWLVGVRVCFLPLSFRMLPIYLWKGKTVRSKCESLKCVINITVSILILKKLGCLALLYIYIYIRTSFILNAMLHILWRYWICSEFHFKSQIIQTLSLWLSIKRIWNKLLPFKMFAFFV